MEKIINDLEKRIGILIEKEMRIDDEKNDIRIFRKEKGGSKNGEVKNEIREENERSVKKKDMRRKLDEDEEKKRKSSMKIMSENRKISEKKMVEKSGFEGIRRKDERKKKRKGMSRLSLEERRRCKIINFL